jgi:hypothetical protein
VRRRTQPRPPGHGDHHAPDAKADPVAAVTAEQLAKLPKDVAAAVNRPQGAWSSPCFADTGKHWRPMADDDRFVRNTLKHVNRYDGQVFVKQVPLAEDRVLRPDRERPQVNQTPSVVVVDAKLKASVIPGYLDHVSINQAIADARADSISPLITDSYLRSANQVCASSRTILSRWSEPTVAARRRASASIKRRPRGRAGYAAAVKRLTRPVRWRGLTCVGEVQRGAEPALRQGHQGRPRRDVAALLSLSSTADGTRKAERKLDARFNDAGLTSCAINRSR